MKHKNQVRYPASAAVVMKMFTDQAFHTRKLDRMGLKYKVLACESSPKAFSIRIERKVPMSAPGLVKKFFPVETTVVNTEAWNPAAKTGKVQVNPQGVPVEVSCVATMKDEGGGCVISYDWDVSARVPLVGGALEKFVIADMEKRADDENRIGIDMVEEYAK